MASNKPQHEHVLSCALCCEDYNEDDRKPKFLACHHTFCRVCLQRWAQGTGTSVECPNCRAHTEVGEKGVDGLQTNHYPAQFRAAFTEPPIPSREEGCNKPSREEGCNKHSREEGCSKPSREEGCSKHAGQPLSFYCATCGEAICRDCTVFEHKESKGHDVENIAAASRRSLELLAEVEAKESAARQQLQEVVEEIKSEICKMKICEEKEINSKREACRTLIETILQEERELVEKITQKYDKEVKQLSAQIEKVVKKIDELPNISERRKAVEENGMKSGIAKTKQSLNTILSEINRQYRTSTNTISTPPLEINRQYCVSKAVFKLDRAVACQHSSATVMLYSDTMKQITSCDAAVKITDQDHDEIESKTTASADGSFLVSFIPKASSKHKAVVMIEGGMLEGSTTEFMVEANNPVMKFGGKGSGNGDLAFPVGVAVDRNGNYYVADLKNKRIQMFGSDGRFVKQHRVPETKDYRSVRRIALDEANNRMLYLPCNTNDSSKGLVRCYDLNDGKDSVFIQYSVQEARDLTVNSQQHVIVVDGGSKCLLEFDSGGSMVRRIDCRAMFSLPVYLTIDAADNLYVTNAEGHCIYKFSATGHFLVKFDKEGRGKGALSSPRGVATDGRVIAVADKYNHRIQLLDMDGGCVGIIGSEGDLLEWPCGVAITSNGHIAVVDFHGHCVKVYRCDMLANQSS